MLIDWFTVIAQMVNLLILVWLMKRFLYKPILGAIDTREKLIATELSSAAQKKDEAQKASEEFRRKNETFDKERATLFTRATEEANAERERLLNEAHKDNDLLKAKRFEMLRSEGTRLHNTIANRASQEVFAIVRSVLKDLANTSLEERISEVFDRRLRALSADEKSIFSEAIKTSGEPATVSSTFDLPTKQQAFIQNALNETFQRPVQVQFSTKPELISGIELGTKGHKLSWTISNYLSLLEESVNQLLNHAEPAVETAPRGQNSEYKS